MITNAAWQEYGKYCDTAIFKLICTRKESF